MNLVTSTVVALSIGAAALMSLPAQAAQVSNIRPHMGQAVALGCSAGHGDVAQTIYIANTTGGSIAQGTKIYWSLFNAKGSQTLSSVLGAGKTISDLAPPGNGGACKAYFLK
jgi:hypothetical protein